MGVKTNNFQRLLHTFRALTELGTEMTAASDFSERAASILTHLMTAVDVREAALFVFRDKPSRLSAVASRGFSAFPEQAFIPLLPRHVHALTSLRAPQPVSRQSWDSFLSSNGNVAPDLLKCIAPLRVGDKLVGLIALGRRDADAVYETDDLEAVGLLCHYVALAVHNHVLSESLATRVSEHLRLLASVQTFYDNALETFASASDIKHINIHGHSLRVGRYAAGIAESLGLEQMEVAGIRAAGYLHDIGKVAVDKALFAKPGALDAEEFREMADHTVVGHQIVQGVQFPWPKVPEVVRSHHERADRSGYPDRLANDEMPQAVRIVAVADTFDAMTSERSYRRSLSVGEALSEIVRITPFKFDPATVQALLIQVRREAAGSGRSRFLEARTVCNIAPADIDVLASALNHKLNHGRVSSA